jgi:poly(hydroxyalkanoate) granule-associated protein
MARKGSFRKREAGSANETGKAVRESAQKIWLAGLGAFERAKSEGPEMFKVLVEQGKGLREKARDAADQALKNVSEGAGEARGKWDKLEQVFEDRVSKSLARLGVLTGREVDDLSRQVQELNESVRNLMRNGGKPASGGAKRAKPAAKRKAKASTGGAKKAAPRKRKAKAAAKE